MRVGIVGAEAAKFTPESEVKAREIIRQLLADPAAVLVSGGCHLGGVDIYAEEIADELGREKIIYKPKHLRWSGGYRERNILIAKTSDQLHNITVASYPDGYTGMRFSYCYHCESMRHVKSGGCWTLKYAALLGKNTEMHTI